MGNNCSCEQNSNNEPFQLYSINDDLHIKPRPKVNILSRPTDTLAPILIKSMDDAEVYLEDHTPNLLYDSRPIKGLSRIQSYDNDRVSQNEDTSAPLSKKGVSFFHLNSIENQANPIEFTSQAHGNEWRLQNIKLDTLIHKSQSKYLWEAVNIANKKRCAVRVSFVESGRLLHSNLSKAEWVLRELNSIKNQYVAEVHSFAIWEAEIQTKSHFVIVIVQELTKCSLRDIQTLKTEEGKTWTQNQILTILHDVYSGLVTCKERHISHGKLLLENVMVAESMRKVMIANFDIKLPLMTNDMRTMTLMSSPGKSLFSKYGQSELSSPASAVPLDKDIHDLTVLILKLVTMDENVGFNYEALKKDDRYKRTYYKVFEELDIIIKRIKPAAQILKELQKHIGDGDKRLELDYMGNMPSTKRTDTYVDTLFTKIDCYEMINQHEAALEVYSELIKILKSKNTKGPKECVEYVKCVNRTIKHYLTMKNWLKAKEVGNELSVLLKQDVALKKVIKAQPKEYICFIFYMGNIYEGMNEPEKAIMMYSKGLVHCGRINIEPEMYLSALKRIANLHRKRKEDVQALEYLKKLVLFYDTQDGYHGDKADAYLNMGDILYQQGLYGQSVKLYLKSFENLKKRKSNNDVALLDVLRKIVENYQNLCEDENVLTYMMSSQELKKTMYGNDSQEYMEEIKKTGEIQMKMKNYQAAQESFLKYHKLCGHNEIMREQYAESLICLGDVYSKTRQFDKATENYEKYVEIQEKIRGNKSREYLRGQDRLASTAFQQGRYKKSLDIQEVTYEIKQGLYSEDDSYLIISMCNLGDTYFSFGQYEKALELHQECLNRLASRQFEFKKECSEVLLKIAYDYDKAGRGGEALTSVYKSFQASLKKGHGTDMEKAVELYEMLGNIKETRVANLDFSRLKTEEE